MEAALEAAGARVGEVEAEEEVGVEAEEVILDAADEPSGAPAGPPVHEPRHFQRATVTVGAAELVLKGEDQHLVREEEVAGTTLHFALIADGHGGKEAALACKRAVVNDMIQQLVARDDGSLRGSAVRDAGRRAFERVHAAVLKDGRTTAGSTLTVVVVNGARHEVTVLHCGDSVARLVPHRSNCSALCEDHRIDTSEAERERLKRLGGKIAHATGKNGGPSGPLRLWPGGVAQARAIGDRDVGAFIDARPFAQTVRLPEGETCCLVLASDGVWDALPPIMVDARARAGLSNAASATAKAIVNASLTQRHAYSHDGDAVPKDDTTCVVIHVEHAADLMRTKQASNGGGCCLDCGGGGQAGSLSNSRNPSPVPVQIRRSMSSRGPSPSMRG